MELEEGRDLGQVKTLKRRSVAARPGLLFLTAAFVSAALLAAVCGQALSHTAQVPYSVYAEKIHEPARAELGRMSAARVLRVVDGDTVVVDLYDPPEGLKGRETVRLIGVDAPELARAGRPVDAGALESKAEAERLLAGAAVFLAFDRELRDRYGRVLAYLYSPEGDCLNLRLVASGAARALLKYPFVFSAAFAEAERAARETRTGLWILD